MYHVKNRMGLKSVKLKVMDNVPYVYHLLDLTTDSVICIAAMKLLAVSVVEGVPQPESVDDVIEVAKEIVQFLWPTYDHSSLDEMQTHKRNNYTAFVIN